MKRTTILSFDNLQQSAPETRIVALHAAFSGFSELKIEMPAEINEYFKTLLLKARAHTDSSECKISLSHDGNLDVGIVLPNRIYRITPLPPSKVYRIEESPPDVNKHRKVIRDAVGHEKVVYVREDDDSIQEGYTE